MNPDGWIVIGTKIDDKEFYSQIREMEKTDIPDIEINPDFDEKKLRQEILTVYEELQKLKDTEILSEEELKKVQLYVEYIDKANQRISELGGRPLIIKGLNDAEENLGNIDEIVKRIDFSNVEKQLNNIGKSIKRTVKQIGRWALAVFGIRSAYMAVRNAMNIISQNDKQLAADIEYIKNVLAYTLEPIVRSIINGIKQILYYVGYITQEWFGKNIFEDADKNLKKANKSAQKLSKTIAGFDEMNIVGSGASNENPSASFNLGGKKDDVDMENTWIGWIAKNSDKIAALIGTMTGALIVMRLTGINPILALGIGTAITGIIWLIEDIIDMIQDPSWNKFGDILGDLALAIGGVALAFIVLNASNPLGWILLAMALVAGLAALIIKNWDKIKETFQKAKDWIKTKFIDPIKGWFNGLPKWAQTLVKGIANIFITALNSIIAAINAFLLPFSAIIAGIGAVIGKSWRWNFLQIPRIPYLAKGGIVNLPSRGVPVGGALAGERGAEGVIPLTDSQQMALLGEAIGKYITINATVVNSMNGRVLSREIQKIQNQSDFATNR